MIDELKSSAGVTEETLERLGKRNFAMKYNKDKFFPFYMSVINGRDKYQVIEQRILNDTKHLMQARKWLENNK